ncbi:MAG: efflux RND transporter permease subunit [Planctomycetota bacterium]
MTSLPRFSVHNPVLVNLLMMSILVGGVYSAFTLVREMFPESNPNQVQITTLYPGATPAEVEKGISIKIEEVIKDIDGVEEIRTINGEGLSAISAVLYSSVDDVDQVVTDIKAAIDTIPRDEFPEDAKEPQVVKFEPILPVIIVAFYGDLDDETLKDMGKRIRDELLEIPGITKVLLQGTRKDEISVEVHPDKLVEYGLSFMEVSDAIARANLDLPGGQIKTSEANVSVRTLGEEDQAPPIGQIIVRSDTSGKVIRLHEIADVVDTFEDADVVSRFNARPAVTVTVSKTPSQDAIDIARKVKALVAGKTGQPLERDWIERLKHLLHFTDEKEIQTVYDRAVNSPYPPIGELKTATNLARFIESRLDLLTRNGAWGLTFVFLSLLLFLNWRVAFWVMMGLLLSVLGTLIAMNVLGYTLNLISMFGLIVVLGLLVDDAIIVGEHVFSRVEKGEEPKLAAIAGTEAVTWPVVCAITTTIVAFAPLIFIEGRMGDFMGVLPVIVLCALSVSLFEALSILPSHLAEWLRPHKHPEKETAANRFRGVAARVRDAQTFFLRHMLYARYDRLLRACVTHRYVTLAGMTGILIAAIGLIEGGRLPIVFIQKMDSETLLAGLEMPVGTPTARTQAAMQTVEEATIVLPELDAMYTLLGAQYSATGGTPSLASHLGQAIVELKPIEQRDRNSEEIIRELREKTRNIPGANSLKYGAVHGGPGGDAINIEIAGEELEDLLAVASLIKQRLREFEGVFDIEDDFDAGRREIKIELLDSARALGLTTQSLATQVRAAFYGLESRILQRDREDVKIMVRHPEACRRRVYDVESMRIATPGGTLVPFTEVARLEEGQAYATIRRKDQRRTVTVTADVDEGIANSREITGSLGEDFPQIERAYPGVQLEFGGQNREFAKSFGSLKKDFAIAILLIYVILAGLFRSYVQPLIVMCAIPFGLIGVAAGHYVLGYPITILSLIGLVALTGIVVNDSLILVDFINRRRREGADVYDAVIDGGRARVRAILLTSITTILGLAPLLTETSFQAKFLIPMGISIAAGLAFATVLTLIGVPSLYMISIDAKRALARFRTTFLGVEAAAH